MELLENKVLEELRKMSINGNLDMFATADAMKRFRLTRKDLMPICIELEKKHMIKIIRRGCRINIKIL